MDPGSALNQMLILVVSFSEEKRNTTQNFSRTDSTPRHAAASKLNHKQDL